MALLFFGIKIAVLVIGLHSVLGERPELDLLYNNGLGSNRDRTTHHKVVLHATEERKNDHTALGEVDSDPPEEVKVKPPGGVKGKPYGEVKGKPHGEVKGKPRGEVKGKPHGEVKGMPDADVKEKPPREDESIPYSEVDSKPTEEVNVKAPEEVRNKLHEEVTGKSHGEVEIKPPGKVKSIPSEEVESKPHEEDESKPQPISGEIESNPHLPFVPVKGKVITNQWETKSVQPSTRPVEDSIAELEHDVQKQPSVNKTCVQTNKAIVDSLHGVIGKLQVNVRHENLEDDEIGNKTNAIEWFQLINKPSEEVVEELKYPELYSIIDGHILPHHTALQNDIKIDPATYIIQDETKINTVKPDSLIDINQSNPTTNNNLPSDILPEIDNSTPTRFVQPEAIQQIYLNQTEPVISSVQLDKLLGLIQTKTQTDSFWDSIHNETTATFPMEQQQIQILTPTDIRPIDIETITDTPSTENPNNTHSDQTSRDYDIDPYSISLLQKKKDQLQVLKDNTVQSCKVKEDKLKMEYNSLLGAIRDEPKLMLLHGKLEKIVLKSYSLDKVTLIIKNHWELLQLKKVVLKAEVEILGQYELHYETCLQYGKYFNYKPVLEVGTRSLSHGATKSAYSTLENAKKNIDDTLNERKQLRLKMQKQQDSFILQKLQSEILFHAKNCELTINNLKVLIEHLKSYPPLNVTSQILCLEMAKTQSVVKSKVLIVIDLLKQVRAIKSEIDELQVQYDQLSQIEECFNRLSQWHVADLTISQLEQTVHQLITSRSVTRDLQTLTRLVVTVPQDVDTSAESSNQANILESHSESHENNKNQSTKEESPPWKGSIKQ